jgi:glutamate synthase (NADPH/NADH) small chain
VEGFYAGADHTLASLVTVDVRWEKSAMGRWQPVTESRLPAQLALLATGFLGPEQSLLQQLATVTDANGNALAEPCEYTTSVQGVFAAGDCRRGESLLVWAIKEGREAARECYRYLSGGFSVLP